MKQMIFFLFLSIALNSFGDPFENFITLYDKYGNEKYMIQEEITQKHHVLQAAYLAKLAGAPEDVIIGLLFHDVGQVAQKEHVGNVEVLHPHHAEFGAQWLEENNFPPYVRDWVNNHALAKVVLCMEDPNYYDHLSLASQMSFHYQKKKYGQPENHYRLVEFREHPRVKDFLAARKCDDMAKIENFVPPKFEEYREMTQRVIENKGAAASDQNWRENIHSMHRSMTENRTAFEQFVRNRTLAG